MSYQVITLDPKGQQIIQIALRYRFVNLIFAALSIGIFLYGGTIHDFYSTNATITVVFRTQQ